MEIEMQILSGIFFSIGLVLLILLIVRTVYRAWHYHDCCSSCRKSTAGGDPKQKPTEGITHELQAISDRQRAEQEARSLGRTNSQTLDPLDPDSLVLPIHGIHFPDPGEEIEEEDTPSGGHNDDFRIVTGGVDEPDKTAAVSKSKQDATIDQESVVNKGNRADSSQHSVHESVRSQADTPTYENLASEHSQTNGGVPSESQSEPIAFSIQETVVNAETAFDDDVTRGESHQHDTLTNEDEGFQKQLINGGVPPPETNTVEEATPTQDLGGNPELTDDTTRAYDKYGLVTEETPYEVIGVENPMEVDDSELHPIYV